MDRNNDKITSEQFYSMLTVMIIGIGILSLPSSLAEKAGADSLIVAIIGSLLYFLLAILIIKLIEKFPKNTIIEIGSFLVGEIFGKILGFGYFLYILALIVLEMRTFGEITKNFLLISTPIEIIMLTFLLVVTYAVRSGIETIARLSVILLPVSMMPAILVMFIALRDIDITYFLPILKTPPMEFIKAVEEMSFSFLGFEFILFLAFFVKDYKNIKKSAKASVFTVAFVYIFTIFIVIGRFGIQKSKSFIWPTIVLFKTIDIPGAFMENVEIVVMSTWLLSIFMTVVGTYFGAVFLLGRLIKSKEHNYLVVPLIPIIYLLALVPENVAVVYDYLGKYSQIGGTTFAVVIPILLLIISFFKKKPAKGRKKNV